MFCDLVGSTGLSTRLDPEDMRDLLATYRTSVIDSVARYNGFIARYLGDGVLVYFGFPQAHEDDAERAVRAALTAVAAVDALKGRADIQLRARAGVATGLVVVGEQLDASGLKERDAIGETPNLAARLQALAGPGEVVVEANTLRLVGRMFDCRALGRLDIKGLFQAVEAWQVSRERAGVSRFQARRADLSPLIGRQEEVDLMLRRWDQARRGQGQVVLLSGEAGIGKSRTAESLLVCVENEPHARLRYFCSPYHVHSALYPFIAHIEAAAGLESGDSAQARLDKLEALLKPAVKNAPTDATLIAELLAVPTGTRYPVPETSPQQKREMTFTALINHLESLAAQKPAVIVFEDAHWIDPTSLDFLNRIVARVADLSVLLVITFRPEFQASWVGQPHVTLLPLRRLDRRDGAEIILGVSKGKALPDPVGERILARADGIPLFIEELTSTVLENGMLREDADRYVLDGPLPPLAIPMTLQASLVARLDRLGPGKEVAQIGAVIGRDFSHEHLAAVAPLTPPDLDAALQRLIAAGLISSRGTPPEATYSFKHSLVQDAAYGTLLKSRRQQLHGSIATLLVERFPAVAENLPEVVAHHLTESGLLSEAIGYCRKAGQRASTRSANQEAVEFFEQALTNLKTLPESPSALEQAFDIRVEMRPALTLLGEPRRSLARLREAEGLAERLNDDRRRGLVRALKANLLAFVGELDEALASGTSALEIARVLEDPEIRVSSTINLEQIHFYRGEYEKVIELASDDLAESPSEISEHFGSATGGDAGAVPSLPAWAITAPASVWDRFWLLMSLSQLGRFAEAAEHEAEMIRVAQTTQYAFSSAVAYSAAGTLHVMKGDWEAAHPLLERGVAIVRTANIVLLLPRMVASSTVVLAQLGKTNEAFERLRECEQILKRQLARGIVGNHGWAYHWLSRASLQLGHLDEAHDLGESAIECSPSHPGLIAHAKHLLGDIAMHPDRFDAEKAEACYREALSLAVPRGMRPIIAHCYCGLGVLYRRTGKIVQAREQMIAATEMYRGMHMDFWLKQAYAEMRELT